MLVRVKVFGHLPPHQKMYKNGPFEQHVQCTSRNGKMRTGRLVWCEKQILQQQRTHSILYFISFIKLQMCLFVHPLLTLRQRTTRIDLLSNPTICLSQNFTENDTFNIGCLSLRLGWIKLRCDTLKDWIEKMSTSWLSFALIQITFLHHWKGNLFIANKAWRPFTLWTV